MSKSLNFRDRGVYQLARNMGLEVGSNRPGDGTRRFEFIRPSGHTFIAVGVRQAELYLQGYCAAREDRQHHKPSPEQAA